MKKLISWILALSLVLCAAVLPAAAEEEGTTTDTVTSASVSRNGKDGRKNMPGGQTQNGQTQNGQQPGGRTRDRKNQQPAQMAQAPAGVPGGAVPPAMPDGTTEETVTPPAAPDGTAESGQQEQGTDSASTPASGKTKDTRNNARMGKKGKAANTAAGTQITFELLLEKGVISREVYDAIMNFIKEYTAETAPAVPAVPAEAEGAST